jgi:hypothetical protein
MAVDGRQYAFTHLVGKLPLTTPMSATWNVRGTGALGHLLPFANAVARTLERRLRPDISPSLDDTFWRIIGLSGRSRRPTESPCEGLLPSAKSLRPTPNGYAAPFYQYVLPHRSRSCNASAGALSKSITATSAGCLAVQHDFTPPQTQGNAHVKQAATARPVTYQ